jgi:hypothetical protein
MCVFFLSCYLALALQTHAHRKTIAADYNYQLLKLATSVL